MTSTRDKSLPARAAAVEALTYSFCVGQNVRLKTDFAHRMPRVDLFRVVGKLPPLGSSPQYKIRNESEPYDRVATQERLERAIELTDPVSGLPS